MFFCFQISEPQRIDFLANNLRAFQGSISQWENLNSEGAFVFSYSCIFSSIIKKNVFWQALFFEPSTWTDLQRLLKKHTKIPVIFWNMSQKSVQIGYFPNGILNIATQEGIWPHFAYLFACSHQHNNRYNLFDFSSIQLWKIRWPWW